VRRARRLDEARVEVSLLLTNNTSDSHSFQLPDPRFGWWLRLNTAEVQSADREIDSAAIDVAPHSVLLLTAIAQVTRDDGLTAMSSNKGAPSEPASTAVATADD
jgi:hypothetical protein